MSDELTQIYVGLHWVGMIGLQGIFAGLQFLDEATQRDLALRL
jgi:hypothetical protein